MSFENTNFDLARLISRQIYLIFNCSSCIAINRTSVLTSLASDIERRNDSPIAFFLVVLGMAEPEQSQRKTRPTIATTLSTRTTIEQTVAKRDIACFIRH